jgi:molecular chaperone DnaK
MLYTAERTKRDLEGKVDKASLDKIDAAAQELRTAVGGQDMGQVREKDEALKKVLQEVGASVYQQQAQKQQAAPGAAGNGQKVSDADYKVVDEGK